MEGLTRTGNLLGREQLLKLMVAQLQYQNPMAPVSSQEFFGQLTQLLMVESLENLRGQMEHMVPRLSPEATVLAQLAALVGRTVRAETAQGEIGFRVEGVSLIDGSWYLIGDGRQVDPALVTGLEGQTGGG
ncbi:MAG: flagellar hook capping FlgD N-terminal domain-containing protein [bacterium]|nr:flagellar hook capping FlgD N-terminal domain-containing protein [bacterium]